MDIKGVLTINYSIFIIPHIIYSEFDLILNYKDNNTKIAEELNSHTIE